jgi:hypothetical protein
MNRVENGSLLQVKPHRLSMMVVTPKLSVFKKLAGKRGMTGAASLNTAGFPFRKRRGTISPFAMIWPPENRYPRQRSFTFLLSGHP